jgi:hypothetical protein
MVGMQSNVGRAREVRTTQGRSREGSAEQGRPAKARQCRA